MGRNSRGATLHPDRPCGPVCTLCSKQPSRCSFTHAADFDDWTALPGHTPQSRCIDNTACICYNCLKKLRKGKHEEKEDSSTKCSECDEPVHCKGVCRQHYREQYSNAARECVMCDTRILSSQPGRKPPNFNVAHDILKSTHSVTITHDHVFCTKCYKLLLSEHSGESTDHHLRTVIEQVLNQEGDQESVALHNTIAHVGEILLNGGACLLTTALQHFNNQLPEPSNKRARWLLAALKLNIGQHICHSSDNMHRQSGTVLYRRGANLVQALHASLVQNARHEALQDICIIDTTEANTACKPLGFSELHDIITVQAKAFVGKEYTSASTLADLDINQIIKEINPLLWEAVWTIVYGNPSDCTKVPTDLSQHTKRVRCV